jgi:methionine-R-sulfoxide reductase
MRVRHWLMASVTAAVAAGVLVQVTACAKTESADNRPAQEGNVKVYVFNKEAKLVGPVESARVVKTDAEWQKVMTPEQYKIVRAKGTERPFCGTLLDNHKDGVYACVGCGLPLYASDAKFQSGTGWPSFFKPVGEGNVVVSTDETHGMVRSEILCARCGGHLGHVFDDGPPPTGQRHCVNSESLKFFGKEELAKLADPVADRPATKPATQAAAK